MDWDPCPLCSSTEKPNLYKNKAGEREYQVRATCAVCECWTVLCQSGCGGFIEAEMKAMYRWNRGEVTASETPGQY